MGRESLASLHRANHVRFDTLALCRMGVSRVAGIDGWSSARFFEVNGRICPNDGGNFEKGFTFIVEFG